MDSFSQRLKELRLNNKISQSKIAKDIGVSDTQYQRYEYGQSDPTLSVIIKLADYFHITLDFLVGRSDDFILPHLKDILKDRIFELVEMADTSDSASAGIDLKHVSDVFFSDSFTFDFLCEFCDQWGVTLNYLLGFE